MPLKKKKKQKRNLSQNGLAKIATLTTKSISSAFTNYKKNKELEKIRVIKLQKIEEKNEILKERKDLKIWEERLNKESNKIKLHEEELRLREKDIKLKDEKQKFEAERLIKKDENLTQIAKELRGLIPIKHSTYLSELGIRERFRRKGLARRLTELRLSLIDTERFTHAVMRTSTANDRAYSLFTSMGFEDMGVYTEVSARRVDGGVRTDRRLFLSRMIEEPTDFSPD